MPKTSNLDRSTRRLSLHARTVELLSLRERAKFDAAKLIAHYRDLGLAAHEVPGIRRAIRVIASRTRQLVLVEVELANA
jgi:hypothetical protein